MAGGNSRTATAEQQRRNCNCFDAELTDFAELADCLELETSVVPETSRKQFFQLKG